jgi:pimeloyl-ACP methyl ester carboxylesterase
MGLTLSSFIPLIDRTIEKYIYYPPKGNIEDYYTILNTQRSMFLEINATNNEEFISVVKIRPYYNYSSDKYIVFSYGNGTNILEMFPYYKYLADQLDVNVIGYDYIGYGLEGDISPCENGCYRSIDTIMGYLLNTCGIDSSDIYLVGQSLGTGVVIDYVSRYIWDTPIILISPYKSICRVVVNSPCVAPIDKFRSKQKLKYVTCPVKIFHGIADRVINISHGRAIYNSLVNKDFNPVWFDEVGHNDILQYITREHYLEILTYRK